MDNLLIRLLKRGRERVSAALAMFATGCSICWLSWSLVHHGHTEQWNWAFATFLASTVAAYITGKITAAKDVAPTEPKVEDGGESA